MSGKALLHAASRLAEKGLMRAGDSLSVRLDGESACYRLIWEGVGPVRLTFAAGHEDPHCSLYLARPDCGAVLVAQAPWSAALGLLSAEMPGLFDEQVRHLGRGVGRLGPTRLAGGDNAFVTLDHRVLCLGMTLDRLVFNAELLEKCAKAFVLAHSSGARLTRVPWFVRAIAGRRLRRDQRFAAQCHGQGKPPVFKSAY